MSKIETNKIDSISGTSTLKIGETNATTLDFDTGLTSITNIPWQLTNTPAFYVYRTSTQSITDSSHTKVEFQTKDLDTDSAFDITTNHRFTVPTGKGGRYYLTAQLTAFSNDNDLRDVRVQIYKNGSRIASTYFNIRTTDNNHRHQAAVITTIDEASAGDYYEMYTWVDVGSGSLSLNMDNLTPRSIYFSGYRLIGV